MKREQIRITRDSLYEQLSAVPMTKLAETSGLSDVGLAKLCERHEMP